MVVVRSLPRPTLDTRSKTSRDLFFFYLLLRPLSASDSIPGGEGTTASTLVFTVGVLSLLLLLSLSFILSFW